MPDYFGQRCSLRSSILHDNDFGLRRLNGKLLDRDHPITRLYDYTFSATFRTEKVQTVAQGRPCLGSTCLVRRERPLKTGIAA